MIKPPMWAVNKAQVAPEWQRYWDGLVEAVFCSRVNDRGLVTGAAFDFSVGSSVIGTPQGQAVYRSSNIKAVMTPAPPYLERVTVLVGHREDRTDSYGAVATIGESNGSLILGWTVGNTDIALSTIFNDPFSNNDDHLTVSKNEYHVYVAQGGGGVSRLWVDGELGIDQTGRGSVLYPYNSAFSIGQFGLTSGIDGYGYHDVAYLWNRLLTPTEVAKVSADPFGPLRQARQIILPLQYERTIRR